MSHTPRKASVRDEVDDQNETVSSETDYTQTSPELPLSVRPGGVRGAKGATPDPEATLIGQGYTSSPELGTSYGVRHVPAAIPTQDRPREMLETPQKYVRPGRPSQQSTMARSINPSRNVYGPSHQGDLMLPGSVTARGPDMTLGVASTGSPSFSDPNRPLRTQFGAPPPYPPPSEKNTSQRNPPLPANGQERFDYQRSYEELAGLIESQPAFQARFPAVGRRVGHGSVLDGRHRMSGDDGQHVRRENPMDLTVRALYRWDFENEVRLKDTERRIAVLEKRSAEKGQGSQHDRNSSRNP